MNTIETLEAIRKANGNCSDYRISKMMGISRQLISELINGKRTMSQELRIKAANLLNQPVEKHLIYCQIERSKKPEVLREWQKLIKAVAVYPVFIGISAALPLGELTRATAHCILC